MELREVPKPVPGAGEVLIEVKAAGVCGTDLHVKHDRFPYWPPVVLGHEFAGGIVRTGEGVATDWVGARVVGEPHTRACGKCYLCRTGNIRLCPDKRSPGWGIDGAFARYLCLPEHLLHKIPDGMSYEEAALVEPTANLVHDVLERGRVEPSDFVAVLGPGPIGLLAAMVARTGGARTVVVIGTARDAERRLPIARELGFDEVWDISEIDPLARTAELTGGRGADLAVECSGAEAAINMAIDLIRKTGRVSVVGMTGKDKIQFAWDKALFKACDLYFNLSTSYTSWDRAIGLIAGRKVDVRPLITHRAPLAEWESVFDDLENQRGLKAVLFP